VRRAFVVVAACLGLVLGMPVLAWAHATLVRAEPAAASLTRTSPTRIRLEFSEELEPSLGRISLVGADGKVITLKVAGDPRNVNALIAPLESPLAPGAYRVKWRVVSADGHPVNGSYVFTVEGGDSTRTNIAPLPGPTPMPMPDSESVEPSEMMTNWGPSIAGAPAIASLLRGVAVGSLMAAAGLFLFLVLSGVDSSAAVRATRMTRWLTIAFCVLLPLHLHAWAMNAWPEHHFSTDMISSTLTSGVGRLELWRTGLALLAGWAFLLARRPRFALVFAALALIVSGATGHSSAIDSLWTTPAKALHLLAGAVWIGGLLWLLTMDRTDAERFEREALRVSSLALTSVILVTLSGVVQWRFFLPTIGGLLDSAYGIVLTAKIAGLLVLVAFGAHHKLRVIPRLRQSTDVAGRFSATLRRELAVMTIVLLLGGLLGYLSPPESMHAQHLQRLQQMHPMQGSTPHTMKQ
jgi:copper transport protein